ncbi:tyrosine-type recombinase/integrase [Alphaproteobacteria bacterium]|nr:tyrosine-type recombinase/integrase [Alphaproteobacteria bacterium]
MSYIKQASYIHKRGGVYQYIRRIPCDIRSHYKTDQLYFSLRTGSFVSANRLSRSITQKLDDYWLGIRLQKIDIPKIAIINASEPIPENGPPLSQATQFYLNLKGTGKSKTFKQAAIRNSGYLINLLGDRSIGEYSTADAGKLRTWLLEKELTIASIRRVFGTIRSIINLTTSEYGLSCNNGFSRIYMPDETRVKSRKSIPVPDILKVQSICREMDDDLRWLIGLVSDTGARLAEIAGLAMSDIKLEAPLPYIQIKPHSWRPLKTKSSSRMVPLIGAALWSAKRIKSSPDSVFAFPRYSNEERCNANSASAALNKWLKPYVPEHCVIHSFRHSLRDRLRAVECPADIIDCIGGWERRGVGESYGDGYPLEVLNKWMLKIT